MGETDKEGILAALRSGDATVCSSEDRAALADMLVADLWRRFAAVNDRENDAWDQVQSRPDWERFRDERIARLKQSLGRWPAPPVHLDPTVTGTIDGDGFTIENLVFATRPGLIVTANLYVPAPLRDAMPGIVICHSHHRPKEQAELQDMGMTWARLGAMVLVMDQLGHGERRQQPHGGREDYHSRFILNLQLDLVGESLMGWMAWDLMRGIDLLLSRPGIDPSRLIMIGAVAGGGDPAAVVTALDSRVTCSIPFNFGGGGRLRAWPNEPPEPAGQAPYNFAGTGSWEGTRNLRLSARDGFLPWIIVAAAAPRPLIYAKEFEYDPEGDPVFDRLRRVYDLCDAPDRLTWTKGWGNVKLRPPAGSHCTNVGEPHRAALYPALERWFGMPTPDPEYQQRREPEDLACLTEEATAELKPRMVHELAADLAAERLAEARRARADLSPADARDALRDALADRLGGVTPDGDPAVRQETEADLAGIAVKRVALEVEPGIVTPFVLLTPAATDSPPVVVGLAHQDKVNFLRDRAEEIAALLERGVAVCLPDVRGTGETEPEKDHAWRVEWNELGTWISTSDLMLGRTLLGARVRDLRSLLAHLRSRGDVDGSRVGLWGDSFSPVNPSEFDDPPMKTDTPPHLAEPLGAAAALLTALFEDDVKAVVARRGIVGFAALLDAPMCYVPHDVIVPGILEVGDLCDVAAALAPRPLRIEAPVDGRNRALSPDEAAARYQPARGAYADHADRFAITSGLSDDVPAWLAGVL